MIAVVQMFPGGLVSSTYKESHCTHTEYLRQTSPFLNSDSFFYVAYGALKKYEETLLLKET